MLLRNKNLPYKGLISISFINLQMHKILIFYLWYVHFPYFINIRILEIHLFYTIAIFYWHLIEILWIFIFLVFYNIFLFLYFSVLSMDFWMSIKIKNLKENVWSYISTFPFLCPLPHIAESQDDGWRLMLTDRFLGWTHLPMVSSP